jgi:hypothetical protein
MLASVPQSCHHDVSSKLQSVACHAFGILGTRCDTLQAWVSNPRNATCTRTILFFCCSCARDRGMKNPFLAQQCALGSVCTPHTSPNSVLCSEASRENVLYAHLTRCMFPLLCSLRRALIHSLAHSPQTHSLHSPVHPNQLVEAELESPDAVWDKAVDGCTLCAHVASPFPIVAPKNEAELIAPVGCLFQLFTSFRSHTPPPPTHTHAHAHPFARTPVRIRDARALVGQT